MLNPYEAPPIDVAPQGPPLGRPPRGIGIWIATSAILTLCALGALAGVGLMLAWLGLAAPDQFADLSGSPILEPIGAGGLSLTAISLAIGYGQLRSVLLYDRIWTQTVAAFLLIAASALLVGAIMLAGMRISIGPSIPAAGGLLVLGLMMLRWHTRLRNARLASPRPIVRQPKSFEA